jgi:chromosome segregation protein
LVWIEKLVCKGFKSFGRDNVTIKFNRGFTCIVGPNGSGKSNVVDALLFVLGQLSAKTLRATVFSDLLYSPPKPGMPAKAKFAVVELHFNNRDRGLQVDADKVVVARRLDDTGKSVCRINDKTVTRTSVLDVLGGIGVDPNGYNLVLQGEIAQMVKVNPNDRRKLIEEIAGISAYDEQKERALKKLTESESNLGKVETQLQERRRQLEKLQEERAGALRYSEVRKRIQEIHVDSLAWNLIKGKSRTQTINETLAERAAEAEKLAKDLIEVEQGLEQTDTEIEEIDNLIDEITGGDSSRVSERYGIVSAAVTHAKTELDRKREEFEKTDGECTTLEEELGSVQDEMQSSKSQMKDEKVELTELDKEIKQVSGTISKLEERLENEQDSYYENTLRLQDFNNQMRSLDEGVSEIRSTIKSDSRELGIAYEDLRDAEDGLTRTEKDLHELNQVVPAKESELQEAKKTEKLKKAELEQVTSHLTALEAEVTESGKILAATREELVRIQARHDALKEAEDTFLKRRRAVAKILELRDSGTIDGIHGTVAELGTINPDYSVALEVAAGNRLSHIVVANEDVATQCIDVLKSDRIGRASFIPLTKIRTRAPGKASKEKGVIGFALDLVTFEPKMRPAFEFVFSDTLVTEDFETAKRMGFSQWRAVSLEGDLVERSGLVTGGHYQRRSTGLSLQIVDTSPEVAERLKGLEAIHSDLREQQDELYEMKMELEKNIESLSRSNYRAEIEVKGQRESLEGKEERVESLKEKIKAINLTIGELEGQIKELRERDNELSAQREHVRTQRDECNEALVKSDAAKLNQEIKDLKEVLEHNKRKHESINAEVTKLRVSIDERLGPKAIELEKALQSLKDAQPGMNDGIKRLELELAERENEFKELKSERDKINEAVKDKRVRQLELKETLRNFRLRHEETREGQTSNEKAVYRLQTEQSRLDIDLVGLKAELENLADVEEETKKREKTRELTRREIDEKDEKIRELERELEAMGPVNLKALTDYDAERVKYDEIVDKKTRLEEEHKEILSFMEEIEAEKTQKFLQVYNDIADNFSTVFARLSPGGEAHLMLENPEHPLMGGITVKTKPRGKELVTLDAMSGGEKTLTGLALIFAIQMYSPSSFYVFDEIDAALDNVNAHNVASMIAEMSKSSQFIVVSLRDTTVRKADLLIGVTNQDGISRVVSVDLEEVEAMA